MCVRSPHFTLRHFPLSYLPNLHTPSPLKAIFPAPPTRNYWFSWRCGGKRWLSPSAMFGFDDRSYLPNDDEQDSSWATEVVVYAFSLLKQSFIFFSLFLSWVCCRFSNINFDVKQLLVFRYQSAVELPLHRLCAILRVYKWESPRFLPVL